MSCRHKTYLRWLALALIVALSGCASRGEVNPNVWMSLTPSERAEADRLERAMAAICRTPCVPPSVIVAFNRTNAHYQNGYDYIVIPRKILTDHPIAHAIIAHELAHAWFADARDDCRTESAAFLCEQAANRHGVAVLMAGYGYSHAQAIHAMWGYLALAVREKVKPSWGHPDPCAEIHAFELSAQIRTYDCREK